MNLIHSIIVGNLIVVAFNLVGMTSGMKPPPLWAYAIGWPAVIVVVAFVSNAT